MPRIPRGNNFNTQPNLGGAKVRNADLLAKQQIESGQKISNLGSQIAQLGAAKKQADDAAYTTKAFNEISLAESERFNDISTRGEDIDLESSRADFNERIKASIEAAPSEEARDFIKQQADTLYNRKLMPMYLKHQSARNIQQRSSDFSAAKDAVLKDVALGRTNFEEAVGRQEAILVGMENTLGGVVDMDKERVKSYNALTTSWLAGRIDQGQGELVIDEIKKGKWDNYGDAGTLKRLSDVAKKDLIQRGNINKTSATKEAKDYINFLKTGQDDTDLAEKYTKENLATTFKEEEAAKIAEEIEDARAFGQAVVELKDASPQEVQALFEKNAPQGVENFTRESKQMGVLLQAYNQRQKAIEADPAGYVNQNTKFGQFAYEELQESLASGELASIQQSITKYNAVQKANQVELGINPRAVTLLPKDLESRFSQQLNDFSEGGEHVVNQLNFMREAYGDDYTLVRSQLVNSGNVKSGVTVIGDMSNKQDQIQLAEAISVSHKDYKGRLENEDYQEIVDDVKLELQEFGETTKDPAFFNENKAAIESLAMKLMTDGLESSAGDAIESAMDKVINNRFELKGSYRIPAERNVNAIEAGVDNMIDKLKDGEIELWIPDSDMNPEDAKAVYIDKLVPNARTTQDNKSIVFEHQNGNAILDKDGEPLVVDFDELEKTIPTFWQNIGF